MKPSPIFPNQDFHGGLGWLDIPVHLILIHAEHIHFETNPPKSKTNP